MSVCIRCGIELNDKNWSSSYQKIRCYVCRQCNKNYHQSRRNKTRILKRIINLIPCECGCGILIKDWVHGHPRKFVNGHNSKGVHRSTETINKMSERQTGKNNNNYRGGKKCSAARHASHRKQFGFIPLNECLVDGWVGHHIDWNYVIFIPEKLHKSIYHSVTKDVNMDIINDKVYDWFVEYYLKGDF